MLRRSHTGRRRSAGVVICVFALIAAGVFATSGAADLESDRAFGNHGVVVRDFYPEAFGPEPYDMVVADDGRIFVLGRMASFGT